MARPLRPVLGLQTYSVRRLVHPSDRLAPPMMQLELVGTHPMIEGEVTNYYFLTGEQCRALAARLLEESDAYLDDLGSPLP